MIKAVASIGANKPPHKKGYKNPSLLSFRINDFKQQLNNLVKIKKFKLASS